MENNDLIRRGDLVDALMSYTWRNEDGFLVDDCDEKKSLIESWLPDVPAVDAAPVVHGTWKRTYNVNGTAIIVCSACKVEAGFDLGNFCPNCGARIDGRGEETADG